MPQAGGMAAIGIPSYRLPKDVLQSEMDIITQLGGRFLFNQQLGRDYKVNDLFGKGYRAVFLGLGCQEGTKLGVANEDTSLRGYESGIGFLLKVHDHVAGIKETKLEGDVVVVGGGNVAMDCVRSAVRMGARTVHLARIASPKKCGNVPTPSIISYSNPFRKVKNTRIFKALWIFPKAWAFRSISNPGFP